MPNTNNPLSISDADCTHCGECAAVCIAGLVRVGKRGPRVLGDPAACMRCGHCVAVCPAKALTHSLLADPTAASSATPADPTGSSTPPLADGCQPLDADWRGSFRRAEQLIKGRRSVRRYESTPVEREAILRLLDTARYAPTGMNSQTVKWLVVYEAAAVKRLAGSVIDWLRSIQTSNQRVAGRYDPTTFIAAWDAGHDPILRGCPHVLLAYGHRDDPLAAGSCTIALTTAELAATAMNLGACWAGFLHMAALFWPATQQQLNLPDGHVTHGALMIGHPAEQYHRIPPRKPADVEWR